MKSWLLVPLFAALTSCQVEEASVLRVFMLNPDHLELVRTEAGDPESVYAADLQAIYEEADTILEAGAVYSVTATDDLPPSGDIHDYFSLSPYWWPDPSKPDGLPYIRRDGETNPERDRISDRKPVETMIDEVGVLARAYYFSGKEVYADWARTLLRTWFLDEATRMNPNLNHGQMVRGLNTGKAGALIGTRRFCLLIDSIGLIEGSQAWTNRDQTEMKAWMTEFLDWLIASPFGLEERMQANNHGTASDMQVVSIALFLDRTYLAELILEHYTFERVRTQIKPDGAQPEELARTKGWNYCVENIKYFFRLARMARHVGVDLYAVHPAGSGDLKSVIDFLLPYTTKKNNWPYMQITEWEPERFAETLQVARAVYDDPAIDAVAEAMGWGEPSLEEFINMPSSE